MKTFQINCDLGYQTQAPADFLFQIEAAHYPFSQTVVRETLSVDPALQVRSFTDANSGNRFFRLHKPLAGPLSVHYEATVQVDVKPADENARELPIHELPDALLHYLMPSRYCESDVLARTAYRTFGDQAPGYARVRAVTAWVTENIEYLIGSSNSMTTARDVLINRAGVCRDFAHLAIAFCRALNIPARLVVGYVKFEQPPQDFHAIFEAYLGGEWCLFDPTGLAPVDRLVRVGTGRDAKDVAFSTIFGAGAVISMNPDIEEVQAAAATDVST